MTPTEFLTFLHQHTEHDVELRCFHNTDRNVKSRAIWTRAPDDVDGFVERYDRPGYGTFFGVATRRNREGDVNGTLEVPALWIDCDGHRPIDELKACFMPPSAIVESGGGIHAYWKLSEPYDVADVVFGEHRDHPIMRALKGLKRVFNGDNKVVDIARVMRLPGTTNSKRDEHVVCTVLSAQDRDYNFDDIEDWLGWQRELVGEPVDPFLAAMEDMNIKPPLDVQEMLDGMVYGENIHEVQLRVSASLQAAGAPEEEIVERIIAATRLAVGQAGARWDWKRETANVRDMLHTAEQKFSKPVAVASNAGATVVSIEAEKRKREPEQSSDGEDIPVFVRAGQVALRIWKKPVISIAGELWTYEQGVWRRFDEDDEAELTAYIQGALSKLKASPSVTNKRNGMQWIISSPELFRRGVRWNSKRVVVGRNAVIEVDTGAIRPHAESDYATIGVDCALDPDADCPTWKAFLEATLDPEVILVLQEWFGSALVRGKTREITKAVFVVGEGNTGKTQLSNVLAGLLANKTCSASVKSLEGDFGYEQFIDATGWVADDAIGKGESLNAEAFKILVTGERVSVNRKRLKAKQLSFDFPVFLTSNALPKIADDSNAVYSRAMIVRMNRVLDRSEAPREATATTVTRDELGGVINWALKGWQRLNERGHFDLPDPMKIELTRFRDSNAPLVAWARRCLTESEYRAVETKDLRASLAGYYQALFGEGTKVPSPQAMLEVARRSFPKSRDGMSRGLRRLLGVELNEEGLAYWQVIDEENGSKFKTTGRKADEVNRVVKAETKLSGERRKSPLTSSKQAIF